MLGKTSSESKNKYRAKAYDQINIVVPKGRKNELQGRAKDVGESLNQFVTKAVDERIERLDDEKTGGV